MLTNDKQIAGDLYAIRLTIGSPNREIDKVITTQFMSVCGVEKY